MTGRGFLYRMVRHMVGAALAVGLRKTSLQHVQDLLQGGSEKRTGERPSTRSLTWSRCSRAARLAAYTASPAASCTGAQGLLLRGHQRIGSMFPHRFSALQAAGHQQQVLTVLDHSLAEGLTSGVVIRTHLQRMGCCPGTGPVSAACGVSPRSAPFRVVASRSRS